MTATQINTRNACQQELDSNLSLESANFWLNKLDKLRDELEFQCAPEFQQSEMTALFKKYFIKYFGE